MKYLSTIIAALILFCAFVDNAYAQQDITPPTLVDMEFTPREIDTSRGPVTVTVSVYITDDLSGMSSAAFFFRKPDTTQQNQVEFRGSVSATEGQEDWYHGHFVLPQYAAYGEWEMFYFMLADNVGNRIDVYKPNDQSEAKDNSWPSLYNGFVFSVGAEQQFDDKLFIPFAVGAVSQNRPAY